MSSKKQTQGRPKSSYVQRLETRIKNLSKKVDKLEQLNEKQKSDFANNFDGAQLPCKAYGKVYNEETKRWIIYVIKFQPDSERGIGKVIDEVDAGDTTIRAEFELKKLLAHDQ